MNFLKQKGLKIQRDGKPVRLKGVNLGGWLMMEAYLLHAPNRSEHEFRNDFRRALGANALKDFDKSFRDSFIQEKDIKRIAVLGFNCLRVPFHYRLLTNEKGKFHKNAFHYLDSVINWAEKHSLWIILDFHAAYGSQNQDWHSDSSGSADFWKHKECQERTLETWRVIADRYKDNESVAGYDILNEAVIKDSKKLNRFYKKAIEVIRSVDTNHILFIEGNNWATDIACLDEFDDDNYVLSIHSYEPLDFTFNFVPGLVYPYKNKTRRSDREVLKRHLKQYYDESIKRNRPVFVGEFGVNTRFGFGNEDMWVQDMMDLFAEMNFHSTYWTYKSVKNPTHPDGLFSYCENPPWVHRDGPDLGWQNFAKYWKKNQTAMMQSWDTDVFHENSHIIKVLQNAS